MFTGIHLEGILHILSVSIPRYKPCDGSTDTERFFRYSTEEFTSEVLKEAREKEKTRKAEAKATAKAKAKATARKTKKEKEEEKKALEAEAKQRRKERKQQKKKQAGPGPAQRYSSLFSQGTLGADYSRAGVVEKE
jgi:ATPase subunit of ABC transporter with duplicated ATPase domains